MIGILLAFSDERMKSKYEQLYLRYSNPLYRIIKSILKEENLSQDALQECFVKLFLNIERIEDIESNRTKAYLTAIAKNVAIDFYRKEKKIRIVTESEDPSLYEIESDFDVEEILANAELSRELSKHIDKLDHKDRMIILLKYFYSYKDNEIANLLEISPVNVRVRVMRSKRKLATLITEQKDGDQCDII